MGSQRTQRTQYRRRTRHPSPTGCRATWLLVGAAMCCDVTCEPAVGEPRPWPAFRLEPAVPCHSTSAAIAVMAVINYSFALLCLLMYAPPIRRTPRHPARRLVRARHNMLRAAGRGEPTTGGGGRFQPFFVFIRPTRHVVLRHAAACNMRRATCSVQHAACNMQRATCSVQHATNRLHARERATLRGAACRRDDCTHEC